ncbi:MAG: lipid-A-disaccharide synthase [Caulobacteraceae bacterium]|nr:lipid-A-disaccharide synthase [Caulobacteraceae bacterium]
MSAPLKVMLVAGEASGDVLGAGLARALKARLGAGGVVFVGVGGARMAAEGVASPFDIAELSLFGLVELVSSAPRVYRRIDETVKMALAEQPDVVVLIDAWGFTIRVGKRLRRRAPGLPLVKYVAPQVWASRPGRARELAGAVDLLLTLLPFETRYFEAEGLSTVFVGNPALSREVSGADPARLRRNIGAGPDAPILLLLPGSRPGEIERLLPPFEEAAGMLAAARPGLRIVVAAADTVADLVRGRVALWKPRAVVVEGEEVKLDAMRAAAVAIACSGTVTSELAMAGCAMVVGYKVRPLTALAIRLLARTRYATLINIAAGAEVVPELLQEACTGPALAEAAGLLLDDPHRRRAQAEAQTAALVKLGRGGPEPSAAAAEAVLRLVGAKRRRQA